MTEIRSQIFFGDLRPKKELHYNGDSRARRLCLELRRMISATSFSLTPTSSPPSHSLTHTPHLGSNLLRPTISPSLFLTHSCCLIFLFFFNVSSCFFDSFVSLFGRTFSLWKFQVQASPLFKRFLGNITAPQYLCQYQFSKI